MKRVLIDSFESCQRLLEMNRCFANGKNIQVDLLYATSANSRWPYENIWGVYLAKPQFAWMALWMAVTSRSRLQKRQVRYFIPKTAEGDYIGKIAIYNPQNLSRQEVVQEKAYLYLFDPVSFQGLPRLDISDQPKSAKKTALIRSGFEQKIVKRREKTYSALVNSSGSSLLVDIDEWQVAIVGPEEVVPSIEVVLDRELTRQLVKRIQWSDEEIGEDYIVGS